MKHETQIDARHDRLIRARERLIIAQDTMQQVDGFIHNECRDIERNKTLELRLLLSKISVSIEVARRDLSEEIQNQKEKNP